MHMQGNSLRSTTRLVMKNSTIQQNTPSGWKQVALGDLVSVTTGSRDANHGSPDGQYPFFTCAQKVSKIDNFSFDTEAVLIAGNGDFNVKYYKGKFDAYQRTYVLSDFQNTTGPFVYQKAKQALNDIMRNNQGSSVKFIKMGDLTDYEFILPPIKEQQKIAEILGAVDEDIAKTQEVIKATEKLKRGLMQQLFTRGIGHTKFKETDRGRIPESWSISNTEDLLIDQKGAIKIGPFGSQLKSTFFVPDGYKVYGQENVFLNDFNAGDHYINENRFDLLKSCELHEGDFVISMMGTIGKCSIVPPGIKQGIMDSHLLRLKIDESRFNKHFILHFFTSPNLQRQIKSLSVGGIMAGLSSKVVKRLLYPTPTLSEQKEIAQILSAVDEKISVNKKLKEKLTLLKKGLMQDLLSGKVRTI